MPIPNSSIETIKLGMRRTPKANSKNPIWKMRVGEGQALQSMTFLSQGTVAMHAASHSSPTLRL